jgi:hypothetical protein
MKKLLITILLCSFTSAMFSQENKNIEISKSLVSSFQKNEYSKIVSTFDQTMKNALPAEKLRQFWDDLNNKCGKYQKYSEITEGKYQNYDIVYVLCHFASMNLKMKVVFNDKNEIAGLFFIPEDQK